MNKSVSEIKINRSTIDAIIAQAKIELPNEACGYLASKDNQIIKSYPMTNIDHSSEHFSFDPSEQFKVVKQSRQEGLVISGNYHSHPESPARPSDEDIRLAYDPNIIYFILSLQEKEPVLKAFNIENGISIPREIIIT